jgi:hypothetical protein
LDISTVTSRAQNAAGNAGLLSDSLAAPAISLRDTVIHTLCYLFVVGSGAPSQK